MTNPGTARPDPPEGEDRRTPAEKDGYRTTPDYPTTVAYLERLASAYPESVRIEDFGLTGEGRELKVVIASKDALFEPAAVHAAGRVVLLVQNSIHAGEMDGKDACLALLRDILQDPGRATLLDRVVLLFVPVYNIDGHERRSAYNRINQNGPAEFGWRANGTNLNLNRDYMKADAPETRAFLRLVRRWEPDFFVDNHVTDGADFQYDVTFGIDATPDVYPGTARWVRESITPELVRRVDASGHLAFPAPVFLKDDADPSQGLALHDDPPRFSTGYMILENRPGMLVELHMLKEYRTRVTGNYEILRALMELLNDHAATLLGLNRDADRAAELLGSEGAAATPFPLCLDRSAESVEVPFRGYAWERVASAISGATKIRYAPTPWNTTLRMDSGTRVALSVKPPAGYIIPPQWTDVIRVLELHGVTLRLTTAAWTGPIESYDCSGMKWPGRPFEGRHPILRASNVERGIGEFGTCVLTRRTASFPRGSAVAPLAQRLSKVAIHWLEPEAPDSALRWGFFDSIFEQKESGEAYVLEKIGPGLLEGNAQLRGEFEQQLRASAEFAGDPGARLEYLYARSRWGRANRVGEYPVGRLPALDGLPLD
ncbi:MAG TPA: M14 family zinc carboxypeptidase [Thermoplasmata archaeon]|nr:M14 family zinc carboxypeptidase [Thermoplasmata archaeon]